jgi:hypothetical protein
VRSSQAGRSGGRGAGELAALDGGAQGVAAVAGERADAQEGLVEGDAEAEHVAARVGLAADELLGGHVRGGPEHGAGDGEAGVVGGRGWDRAGVLGGIEGEGGWLWGQVRGGWLWGQVRGGWLWGQVAGRGRTVGGGGGWLFGQVRWGWPIGQVARGGERGRGGGVDGGLAEADAGEAEVEDARALVVADEHVVGFKVAVDEAAGVRGGEAAADLQVHGDDLAPAAGRGGLPGAQGLALDVLHRQVDLAEVLADLVDLDDVGVRQAGERLGLAAGAGADVGVVAVGADELDSDLAVQLLVVRGVDDAHAAGADAAEHGEAADAGGLRGGRRTGGP